MKLNIANPASGAQKKIEIEDEHKLQFLWDKRMAEEVQGEHLGDEFKGYVFKITGGNDKEGFPMRQGVLVSKRVRLLLRRGMPCYKAKRKGERRRKSVRGCIVGPDIAVLSLVIVKRGEQDLPGLTDVQIPRRLGPKRLDKIRKMFNLTKEDDPKDYIVRRKVKTKTGNVIIKKPKIQRLITPAVLHRRKTEKKQQIRRKERSKQNRVNYFNRLTKKVEAVKKAKKNINQALKTTKSAEPKKPKTQQQAKPSTTAQPGKKAGKTAQEPKGKPMPKQQAKVTAKPESKPQPPPAQPKKASQPKSQPKAKGGKPQEQTQGQPQPKTKPKPEAKPPTKPKGQPQGKNTKQAKK